MNEIDNEEVIESFEQIVFAFRDDFDPYAIEVCQHLVFQYKRCFGFERFAKSIENINNENYEEDDEGTPLTAMQSISAIGRVLNSIDKN